jgi:hypothetical protein
VVVVEVKVKEEEDFFLLVLGLQWFPSSGHRQIDHFKWETLMRKT